MANEVITLEHPGNYEPSEAQLKRVPKDRLVSMETTIGEKTVVTLKPKASTASTPKPAKPAKPAKADEKPEAALPSASEV